MKPARRDDIRARLIGRALWVYTALVFLATVLAWEIYIAASRPPYLRPLFRKEDRYSDLIAYTVKTAHLLGGSQRLGAGLPVYNYPAPAAFVYKFLLYAVPEHPIGTYVVILCAVLIAMLWMAFRAFTEDMGELSTNKRSFRVAASCALLTTAVAGYPLAFTVDRGNIEGIVWAISGLAVCLMLRGRYSIAAVLLGIAIAVKPFPALFLAILIARARYKDALKSLGIAAAVTVLALVAIGPNPVTSYRNLQPGLDIYLARYVTNLPSPKEARFDHSILDRAKFAAVMIEMKGPHPSRLPDEVVRLANGPGGWKPARLIAQSYPVIVLTAVGLFILVFRNKPILNQVTAAAIAINILPLSAADYTLLHLYVPFGAWIVFLVREVATGRVAMPARTAFLIATEYALLFSPLTFLALYAADAKLLLLLALLVHTARTPMPSEFFGDPAHWPPEVNQSHSTRPASA